MEITADSQPLTCGPVNYRLEFEVIPAAQQFTGTVTHTSAILRKLNCEIVSYPKTTLLLPVGTYKWRVRERTQTASAWVNFNGGSVAFIVAPASPDILVPSVALANVASSPSQLTLVVNAVFHNRGVSATGNFTWKAYLSTDQALQASDTLIFTSTAPISGPGQSTITDASPTLSLNPRPPLGSYYVVVEADPAPPGCTTGCGQVLEYDETNNVGSTPNSFINGVDLVATGISDGPPSASPGDSITLTLDFLTQGTEVPANPVDFRVVAVRDFSPVGPSVLYSNSITVGDNQIFRFPVTFTLPPGAPGGDVHWGLELDATHTLLEAIETNNTVVTPRRTHIRQADLQADFADLVDARTGISVRKADIGFPARLQVHATNIGDWPSTPVQVGLIFSRDNTLSLLQDHLFADVAIPSLGAGAASSSAVFDVTVNIPTHDASGRALIAGDYYLFVYLDSFNAIDEAQEGNNTKVISGPVQLRAPSPDYAVTSVRSVITAAGGEWIPLTRVIRNIGTQDGPRTEYRCFASPNAIITTLDFPLDFVESNGTTVASHHVQLRIGGVDEATEIVALPGSIPEGTYFFGCIVDPADVIRELEEDNNSKSSSSPALISRQVFRIVTQQLPDGVIGVPYAFRLITSGATSPASWAADPATPLPKGVSLTVDGTLQGTPTQMGVSTFKVYATSGKFLAQAVLVARVRPTSAELTITSETLPPVINSTNAQYQGVLSASGGAQPYRWSIAKGSLPAGLTLDSESGLISGNPRSGLANGNVEVVVRVRDALGGIAERALKMRVLAPGSLAIITVGIPDSLVGERYVADLAVAMAGGGALSRPITWSVVGGALPHGLALKTHSDQSTGLLTGTPDVAGTYATTVQAADDDGRADAVDFVIRVFPSRLKVFLAQSPPATIRVGDALDLTVTSDGIGASYRLYAGTLPPGIALSTDGKLGGTIPEEPRAARTYNFVVESTDAAGGTGLGAFALEVLPKTEASGCATSGAGSMPSAPMALLALGGLVLLRAFISVGKGSSRGRAAASPSEGAW